MKTEVVLGGVMAAAFVAGAGFGVLATRPAIAQPSQPYRTSSPFSQPPQPAQAIQSGQPEGLWEPVGGVAISSDGRAQTFFISRSNNLVLQCEKRTASVVCTPPARLPAG